MIHMLSRFDIEPDVTVDVFRAEYQTFTAQMVSAGMVESSGEIGRRERNTPMDTDDEQAPEYYVIMSFKDRRQLDETYAYLTGKEAQDATAHTFVHRSVRNAVFTCWRDLD